MERVKTVPFMKLKDIVSMDKSPNLIMIIMILPTIAVAVVKTQVKDVQKSWAN